MPGPCSQASVIIPVYDNVTTLRRAVSSVQRQTLRQLEIVIIDDASQDASLNLAHELAASDGQICVLSLASNGGKSRAMNITTREARGAWSRCLTPTVGTSPIG